VSATIPAPAACAPEPGLACTVEEHDHGYPGLADDNPEQAVDAGGQMLCNDCNHPMFYDRATESYWHTEPEVTCFLIQVARPGEDWSGASDEEVAGALRGLADGQADDMGLLLSEAARRLSDRR